MKALSFYFFLSSFSSLSNLYCSSTHTKALVSNHQLDPIQATAAEPLVFAPGDHDHILSGVFNQFLSANPRASRINKKSANNPALID